MDTSFIERRAGRLKVGRLARAQKALNDLKLLKKQGFQVKDEAIKALTEEVWAAKGIRQIWWCQYCPGWKLVLYVRSLETICSNGHEARLLWESPTEQEASLVAQLLAQPKSPQNRSLQENSLPLLDSLDISPLPLLDLSSFQRKNSDLSAVDSHNFQGDTTET